VPPESRNCATSSGHLGGAFQEEQVATTVDDLQSGLADAVGEDPAVEERNDRVVVAGQHEGRLTKRSQPGQARPTYRPVLLVHLVRT
jgi:hypothetical protein